MGKQMIRIFLTRFLESEKNHSADENTVGGTSRAEHGQSHRAAFRLVPIPWGTILNGFQAILPDPLPPVCPFVSLRPPSTFDDIPIYSQLLAGTLYDQIPSRKTLFSISSPPAILSCPRSPCSISPLSGRSRYLILFSYIFIFFSSA